MSESNPNSNVNHSVTQAIQSVRQMGNVITDGSLSLEQEADHINKMHLEVFNIDLGLVEARVKLYRAFGEILIVHRDHVWKANKKWQKWASTRFPKIKSTRRDHCMKLAEAGQSLEVFYFLGIDFLYPFINLMYEFWGDPEIAVVADFFNLRVGQNIVNVDQCKYRINIEKLHEYFKFKREMKGLQFDKGLVLEVISADVCFDTYDYKAIADLASNPAAQYDYLFEMLVNGGSSKSASSSSSSQESIIVLMAKFIQLADKHFSCGTFPNYVTRKEFKPFLSRAEKYFKTFRSKTQSTTT